MRLFSDWRKRTKWEDGLTWYRLRYLDPPTQAINLLSRSQAVGRVALHYRPGDPVSQLYLGIPQKHTRLLERMAADFDFSLTPKPPEVTIPPAQPMTAMTGLPWDSAFVAHIANEFAFVSLEKGGGHGPYLPQPPSTGPGGGAATWTMPANPPPGLTLKPSWNGLEPMIPTAGHWPLGRTTSGDPLSVCGRINLYGRQETVAVWLVEQVAQMVAHDPANLVVIDGAGDLVPRLKRKAAVTRLLGKGLAYIDLDAPPVAGGFNPLAAVPGETEAALAERWQGWFGGMNVRPEGIRLLAQARRDGVGDLPALGKWLKRAERQGTNLAVSNLDRALNRLTADPDLREWLAWPANRFETLPEGALFFTCKQTDWDRRQLLRMAVLGAIQVAGVRLVVHAFPWETVDVAGQEQIVLSNGPRLPGSAVVLTGCHAQGAALLAVRFLGGNLEMQENLELLGPAEGLVVTEAGWVVTRWTGENRPATGRGQKPVPNVPGEEMRDNTTILDKWDV